MNEIDLCATVSEHIPVPYDVLLAMAQIRLHECARQILDIHGSIMLTCLCKMCAIFTV